MKYAFYPGCVAQGAAPELYNSTIEVCRKLGIELDAESMQSASCTGAGVLQEKNQRLGDTLNARNFALAERSGLPLLTICSTCQGVMSQANQRLTADADYLSSVNEDLAEEGLEYKGTADPKHLLWIIVEDIGIDKLKSMVVRPLTGFRAAPFYGCYLVRPSSALGFAENPERLGALEQVIEAVGATVVDFPGKTLCCGFPNSHHQPDQFNEDGVESYAGREGQGSAGNGDAMPAVPSQSGRLSAGGGEAGTAANRPADSSLAADDRSCARH